jgi:hypothetical protein
MQKPVERKNKMLKELKDGVITYAQFITSCLAWLMEPELWREIIVKYEPPPPQIKEWTDYVNMSTFEKSKMTEAFFRIPEIERYLKAKSEAFSWNIGMYGWLKEQKAIIPDTAENLGIHRKLDAKIYEFKNWMRRFAPKYIGFEEAKERRVEREQPEEVGDMASSAIDTLGGQII